MRNKVLVSVAQWLLPVAFLLVIHIVVVLGDVGENHLVIRMDQMSQEFWKLGHLDFLHVGTLSEDTVHVGAQVSLDVCIVQLSHSLSCKQG